MDRKQLKARRGRGAAPIDQATKKNKAKAKGANPKQQKPTKKQEPLKVETPEIKAPADPQAED